MTTRAPSFDYIIVGAGSAGCVLGGSSTINGMAFARGHHLDYDDWAAQGASGWSYADVLPYFRRSEHSWAGKNHYHGISGPLGVTQVHHPGLLFEALRDAARTAGHPYTEDYHGDVSDGIARPELTTFKGWRSSTARRGRRSRSRVELRLWRTSIHNIVPLGERRAALLIQKQVLHRDKQQRAGSAGLGLDG
jgi:choline dehydrogenase-like flavoprotein